MPAEFVGMAETKGGHIEIGGLRVPWREWCDGKQAVYVRRISRDLSVIEICIARHDGFAQEELDEQNREAEAYPLGPKEYWRGEMVGKYTYGTDGHKMTDEEFELDWEECEDE